MVLAYVPYGFYNRTVGIIRSDKLRGSTRALGISKSRSGKRSPAGIIRFEKLREVKCLRHRAKKRPETD